MAVLPLRHFSPVEFRCKCGCGAGMEKMDADLLQMLDEARDLAGIPTGKRKLMVGSSSLHGGA